MLQGHGSDLVGGYMPFHLIDAVLGGSMLTLSLMIAAVAAYVCYGLSFLDEGLRGLAALLVFFFTMIGATGLFGRVIHAMCPLAVGTFSLIHPSRAANVWKLLGFLNLFNLSVLIHTYLCPVNLRWIVYRFLGAEIGSNVMIGGKIIEPWMISVGNTVILGEDCLVLGHVISRQEVTLGRVQIGDNVTIGVKAVIMPDVEIGSGAVVWAGAVVPMGTRIGPGEEWAGVPARRVTRSGRAQVSP